MKTIILKFLIKKRIIKNGYINPIIIWLFLLLIPALMFSLNYNEEKQKKYSSDEELLGIVLKQYDEKNFIDLENEKMKKEKKLLREKQIQIKKEKKLLKEKQSQIKKENDSEIKNKKEKEKDNLYLLIQKAKKNKKDLTEWDYFRLKVYQTSLNIKKKYPTIGGTPEQIYDWSMKTFYQESKYQENAKNPHSSAYGLFQAMAATRKNLNMPTGLSLIQQVPYYEKYIFWQIDSQKLNVSKINTSLDWYLIVFYPNLSDKNDKSIFAKCNHYNKKFCRKRGGWKKCNYHANIGYDLDKNAIIYKWEIGDHLMKKF